MSSVIELCESIDSPSVTAIVVFVCVLAGIAITSLVLIVAFVPLRHTDREAMLLSEEDSGIDINDQPLTTLREQAQ